MSSLLTVLDSDNTTITPVYILAGQSNARGRAVIANASAAYQGTISGAYIWTGSAFATLEAGVNNDGTTGSDFGPEMSMMKKLQELHGTDVYLVKEALGGTGLDDEWDPETGSEYSALFVKIAAAIADLQSSGKTPKIMGFIWIQGEEDSKTIANAAAYETRLASLVQEVRTDCAAIINADFSFVTAEAIPFANSTLLELPVIRNAQNEVATTAPNIHLVSTSDLTDIGDDLHFDAASQETLGIRCAISAVTTSTIEASASFSPDHIAGLRLWLDASDISTITKDGSDNVSDWDSKTMTAYTATQSTGSLKPVYSATAAGGQPGITFDGTDDRFVVGSSSNWKYMHDLTGATLFAAVHITDSNPNQIMTIYSTGQRTGGQVNLNWYLDDRSSSSRNERVGLAVGNGSSLVINAMSADDAMNYEELSVLSARLKTEAGSNNDAYVYVNDSEVDNANQDATPATGNSQFPLNIGDASTSSGESAFKGVIHELLIYEGQLTLVEQTQVHDYLAAKYASS